MLTSLKVVRIAADDCDSTSRSAIRARSRDMGTRCSGRAPCAGTGTGGIGALARGSEITGGDGSVIVFAAGAALAAADAVAREPIACTTSPLVMRPPRPVPATLVGSIPCSTIILRADGKAVTGLAGGGAV